MSTPTFEMPRQSGAEDREVVLTRIREMEKSFVDAVHVAGRKSNFAPELSALVMRRTVFDDRIFEYKYELSQQPPDLNDLATLVP